MNLSDGRKYHHIAVLVASALLLALLILFTASIRTDAQPTMPTPVAGSQVMRDLYVTTSSAFPNDDIGLREVALAGGATLCSTGDCDYSDLEVALSTVTSDTYLVVLPDDNFEYTYVVTFSDDIDIYTLEDYTIYSRTISGGYEYYTAQTSMFTISSTNTSITIPASASDTYYNNVGATGEITFTLPKASEGLHYCFYIYAAQTVNVDPNDADLIHHETDTAGDMITDNTEGDSICLIAISSTHWIPVDIVGTWADGN